MLGGRCGSTREGEDKKEEETSVRTKMRRQTAYTQRARAMSHHRSKLCNLADWCSLDAGDGWTLVDETRTAKTAVSGNAEAG